MKPKKIFLVILIVILFVGGFFTLEYAGWLNYNFFAQKKAQTTNNIYTQGPAYTQAMELQLHEMQLAYYKAKTKNQRASLRDMIIHEMADYNGPLSPDLKKFYNSIKKRYNQ